MQKHNKSEAAQTGLLPTGQSIQRRSWGKPRSMMPGETTTWVRRREFGVRGRRGPFRTQQLGRERDVLGAVQCLGKAAAFAEPLLAEEERVPGCPCGLVVPFGAFDPRLSLGGRRRPSPPHRLQLMGQLRRVGLSVI
mmetsp:Transcript_1231/g.3578  ORF Transcript_1231/g.3578 Transcript_1231/m.3578 type:complete len:137 (+) Transcript_1231:644-1054(+)